MRFTIDELNAKADEQYEPVELDLPSGGVARFENLLRLDEDKQKRVGGLLDQVSKGNSQVVDILTRIGQMRALPIAPMIPSPRAYGYRNKITLH